MIRYAIKIVDEFGINVKEVPGDWTSAEAMNEVSKLEGLREGDKVLIVTVGVTPTKVFKRYRVGQRGPIPE